MEIVNRKNELSERKIAEAAFHKINEIRGKMSNVLLLDTDDPADAANHFEAGDLVILCGAYRDGCLTTAKEALEAKGIQVKFHAVASIPMFPICKELDELLEEMLYNEPITPKEL